MAESRMSHESITQTEAQDEPEVISTGMRYSKTTGLDASRPVKKKWLDIVQVGLNPSNLRGRDPDTGNLEKLEDTHLVSVLMSLGRTVPDNPGKGVDQYHTIKAARFRRKYMPRQKPK